MFLTEYEGFGKAFGPAQIDIRFYQLQSYALPVAQVVPHMVPIEPLPTMATATQVWPVRRRAQRAHPPKPRSSKTGDGPTAGDSEDGGEQSADEAVAMDTGAEEFDDGGLLEEALAASEELCLAAFGGADPDEEATTTNPETAPEPVLAGSSRDPPRPPPPPAAAAEPAVGAAEQPGEEAKPRRGADATVAMPGGTISFYRSKMAFEAVCDNKAHGRCVATRTARAKGGVGADGHPRCGRPLGFLAAWLARGEHVTTKTEHWSEFGTSHEERVACRALFSGTPSGRLLLSREREAGPGEPAELASLDGYM